MPAMTRTADTVARVCKKVFPFFERLGVHVTPVHFYEPVPDTRTLPASLWERPSELVGLDLNSGVQLDVLQSIREMSDELAALSAGSDGAPGVPAGRSAGVPRFRPDNGHFDHADAYALYTVLRESRPRRVIEVGSGYSTLVAAAALERNRAEGHECALACVEPFPKPWIRDVAAVTNLFEQPLESLPLEELVNLDAGDVLILDSTHVVRTGGDVVYEFLDIVPRLRPGVLVHVHDIFLPEEYPKAWVFEQRRFWTEQYLVQAFLAFNRAWEIVWAGNWLRLNFPREWAEAMPSVPDTFVPGSLWIRRRATPTDTA